MPTDNPLLGLPGIVTVTLYLSSLLLLGWLGRRARKEISLADFYLSGRSLGFFVLILTLYATQYSGNTLLGFSASAYRQGFVFLVSVTFMMGIIAIYLIYAPKLQRLGSQRNYITLSDYVQDRFGLRLLSVLISLSSIVAMANYILSNLKAIGYTAETVTQGEISFAQGVIFLALIIVIYETLGGLRSVAWTDVIQGLVLLLGCSVIFTAIMIYYNGLETLTVELKQKQPPFWQPLTWADCRQWLSTLFVVSLGIALYPHAIQRIYSARSPLVLRRAFQVMVFMPLATTLLMITVGIIGAAQFPNLSRLESESITLLMVQDLSQNLPLLHGVIVLFIAAVLAAIMSTIDSALLAISSMITQDLYRPLNPNASQAHLTRVGKWISWGLMALIVPLAIWLPQTIWRLIEIKVELLIQIAPALLLGLHWSRLHGRAVLAGFIVGTLTTLFFTIGNYITGSIPAKLWGVHAGLIGFMVNLLTIVAITALRSAANQTGLRRQAET